jgi:hypothetical protein
MSKFDEYLVEAKSVQDQLRNWLDAGDEDGGSDSDEELCAQFQDLCYTIIKNYPKAKSAVDKWIKAYETDEGYEDEADEFYTDMVWKAQDIVRSVL